jgi:CSLREA domain-containing protein
MVSSDLAIHLGKRESAAAVYQSARLRSMRMLAIAVAFVLALSAATANATTYTVDTLNDTSGKSDCSLRDAINAANGTPTSGSTCTTPGTGSDTINFSITGTITLAETLPQVTDTLLTINGPAYPSIAISGGGEVRVMQVASGARLNLKDLTITHGYTQESCGSGIVNDGDLTITNSIITSNDAAEFFANGGAGGGICNGNKLMIVNGTISNNSAGAGGCGGIANGGNLTIINSTVTGNSTASGDLVGGRGGGVCNFDKLIIANSTFSGNTAEGGGGENSGDLTVINSTFSGNTADVAEFGGTGGAIQNVRQGSSTLINSTFSGNKAKVSPHLPTSMETSKRQPLLWASPAGKCCKQRLRRSAEDRTIIGASSAAGTASTSA